MKGKRFIASFSGGKDSVLAMYRCIKQGMVPMALLTTCQKESRSWFHGIPRAVLEAVSDSLEIPLYIIETDGADYEERFEEALKALKAKGADVCIFGDIDIADHLEWGRERGKATNLEVYFPLWQESREKLVYEFLGAGFVTHLNVVNTKLLDMRFLGKQLTYKLADEIKASGADMCGENGEYHTFVSGGPLFKKALEIVWGEPLFFDHQGVVTLNLKEDSTKI